MTRLGTGIRYSTGRSAASDTNPWEPQPIFIAPCQMHPNANAAHITLPSPLAKPLHPGTSPWHAAHSRPHSSHGCQPPPMPQCCGKASFKRASLQLHPSPRLPAALAFKFVPCPPAPALAVLAPRTTTHPPGAWGVLQRDSHASAKPYALLSTWGCATGHCALTPMFEHGVMMSDVLVGCHRVSGA